MLEAAKAQGSITTEFLSARLEMIKLVNAGSVPLRIKPDKNAELQDKLKAARKRSLEVVRGRQINNKTKFRAMTVRRWKELNPDKGEPRGNGEETVMTTKNGVAQEVVLVRKRHKDEWDMDIEDFEGVVQHEEYDSGAGVLSEKQLDKKFKALGDHFQQAANVTANTEAELAANPEETDTAEEEEKGLGEKVESDDEDCILAGICGTSIVRSPGKLGGARGAAAGHAAVGARARPGAAPKTPKPSHGLGAPPRAAAATPAATRTSAAPAPLPTSEENKGSKRKKAGGDPDAFEPLDYLRQDGLAKLEDDFEELCKTLTAPGPFQNRCFSDAAATEFSTAVKAGVAKAKAVNGQAIAFYWKIWKRVNVSQTILDAAADFRNKVTAVMCFLTQFTGRDLESTLDVDKTSEMISTLAGHSIEVPSRCRLVFYQAQAADLVQFGRFGELLNHLSPDINGLPGVLAEEQRQINDRILERAVLRLTTCFGDASADVFKDRRPVQS